MGFAVPDLRKSASFTELMKESCRTTGVASMVGLSGSAAKCKVSLKGKDDPEESWSGPASCVDNT